MSSRCSACEAPSLVAHLRVAPASVGADALVPTTDAFGSALADIVRCTACGHMQLERLPSEAELEGAVARWPRSSST